MSTLDKEPRRINRRGFFKAAGAVVGSFIAACAPQVLAPSTEAPPTNTARPPESTSTATATVTNEPIVPTATKEPTPAKVEPLPAVGLKYHPEQLLHPSGREGLVVGNKYSITELRKIASGEQSDVWIDTTEGAQGLLDAVLVAVGTATRQGFEIDEELSSVNLDEPGTGRRTMVLVPKTQENEPARNSILLIKYDTATNTVAESIDPGNLVPAFVSPVGTGYWQEEALPTGWTPIGLIVVRGPDGVVYLTFSGDVLTEYTEYNTDRNTVPVRNSLTQSWEMPPADLTPIVAVAELKLPGVADQYDIIWNFDAYDLILKEPKVNEPTSAVARMKWSQAGVKGPWEITTVGQAYIEQIKLQEAATKTWQELVGYDPKIDKMAFNGEEYGLPFRSVIMVNAPGEENSITIKNLEVKVIDAQRGKRHINRVMAEINNNGMVAIVDNSNNFEVVVKEGESPRVTASSEDNQAITASPMAQVKPRVTEGMKFQLDEDDNLVLANTLTGEIISDRSLYEQYMLVKDITSVITGRPVNDFGGNWANHGFSHGGEQPYGDTYSRYLLDKNGNLTVVGYYPNDEYLRNLMTYSDSSLANAALNSLLTETVINPDILWELFSGNPPFDRFPGRINSIAASEHAYKGAVVEIREAFITDQSTGTNLPVRYIVETE